MLIRKAKIEDTKEIAQYMMLAMGEIVYTFIGENSIEKATKFLESLIIRKSNQYSFENCWVVENEKELIALASIYDGEKLPLLRKPVTEAIRMMFDRDFNPEDETQKGEYYIDCVAVHTQQQGKGMGSKLFEFLISEYVHKSHMILGLLVEENNLNAKRFYSKFGFEIVGYKTLAGKKMHHLQLNSSSMDRLKIHEN